MSDQTIDVPGDEDARLDVGDKLTINFVADCRFCSPDSASTYFKPALPNGDHDKDTSWTGTAQQAGEDTSTNHHSVDKGTECSSRLRSSTRSIQIGDGMPH